MVSGRLDPLPQAPCTDTLSVKLNTDTVWHEGEMFEGRWANSRRQSMQWRQRRLSLCSRYYGLIVTDCRWKQVCYRDL